MAEPAWITVKVCTPMVSVAVRENEVGLAATEYSTVPVSVPVAPGVTVTAVTVRKGALGVAVQTHPDWVLTVMLPASLPAETDRLLGEIE